MSLFLIQCVFRYKHFSHPFLFFNIRYDQGRRENRGYRGSTPCSSDRTGGRQGVILVVFFEFRQCFSKNMAVFFKLVVFFCIFFYISVVFFQKYGSVFEMMVVFFAFRQCFFQKSGSVFQNFFWQCLSPVDFEPQRRPCIYSKILLHFTLDIQFLYIDIRN